MSSPKAAAATRRAVARASGSSSGAANTCMPLPPPPAEGLIRIGYVIPAAAAARASSSRPGSETPGTVGTPAADTCRLARILSPIVSRASTPGPMNTIPASAHARAKAAFSDRNP